MSESVKIAVRVRSFNTREKEKGAKLIIAMRGNTTTIKNLQNPNKNKDFSFDYSYWSHDGFREDSVTKMLVQDKPGSRYASQETIYNDLGKGVLNNAMQGYNCCLFAYGQTGSGKSYSMVGTHENKGIVPTTLTHLFDMIKESNVDGTKKFSVTLSMLEIYNERIQDLLSSDKAPPGGLKVRQDKNQSFYVVDLNHVTVKDYKAVEKYMDQGMKTRTVAATQMNATSSRAHTIITIEFKQIFKGKNSSTRSSTINLVDLAGSERATGTGATGDRLKEGANINKSLSTLGNVISALATNSTKQKKDKFVPFRDSILTQLLKSSLGGNSKTVMIAALSPADINYDETMSTLRYANRAKEIKNKVIVNENPLNKMIQDLQKENAQLKKRLEGGIPANVDVKGMSPEDIEKLRKEIEAEILKDIEERNQLLKVYEDDAEEEVQETLQEEEPQEQLEKLARLENLNEDPLLSGVLKYPVETNAGGSLADRIVLGRLGDISIGGPGIRENHAVITKDKKNVWWIEPIDTAGTDVNLRVNGRPVEDKTRINNSDRILIGSSSIFLFFAPNQASSTRTSSMVWNYDMAMTEVARADGLGEDLSFLHAEIVEILPMVQEVNAIAAELKKFKRFSVVILPAIAQDVRPGTDVKPKVVIKMESLINKNSWIWQKDQFVFRRYIMQEMYQTFVDGIDISQIPRDRDPFWEPDSDIVIGDAMCGLMNLSYNVSMEHSLPVLDFKGQIEGEVTVLIQPCVPGTNDVVPDTPEYMVDKPSELLNKPYNFKITIKKLKLVKTRFIHGSRIQYKFYHEDASHEELIRTETVMDTLEPVFDHSKDFAVDKLTNYYMNYLSEGQIRFRVFGIQKDSNQGFQAIVALNPRLFEMDKEKTERIILEKLNSHLTKKVDGIKECCLEWARKDPDQQNFDSFFKEISSSVFRNRNRFKIRAKIIGKAVVAGKKLQTDNGNQEPIQRARSATIQIRGSGEEGSEVCSIQ